MPRFRRTTWIAGLCALAFALPRGAAWAAPDVVRATLDNGLRVVVVHDSLAPVVTTEINYLVGSNDAPPGFPGMAHALEHMMFRGSTGLNKDQLAEVASLLGGAYNADTTETVTQFFYTAPAKDLDVVLRIEALRMNGATLAEADWDKERGAIEQEVSRDMSSPVYKYLKELQATLFAGTPYAHDALGTRVSFDKTNATLLRKFYETWYAPNNAILVIAGDVDPAQAIADARKRFGALPRKSLPTHAPIDLRPVKAETLTYPTDLPIGLATIAMRMPGLQDKNYAAATVLADAIGSERAKLFGLVVDGQALVSQFSYQPKAKVGFAVAAAGFPKGGDPKPLLAEMRAILSDVAAHGVPDDLVAAAKRQEIAALSFDANDISGLASSWSEALAFQNLQSPEDMIQEFDAVTPADVARVAKQVLNETNEVTAILTPTDQGKPVAGKGFGGAESFAVTPSGKVKLPDWAETALTRLELPVPGPKPVVSMLPNGIRLLVRQTNVSPTVSVYGEIRQEPALQTPKGQEGVAGLVDQLLDYGTTHHNRLAFQKALDDIAAQEQAGTSFQLKVLTREFKPGMALLAENELQPAFPARAFSVVQRQTEQNLAGLLQSPAYRFHRAIAKAVVPAGDPTLRQATPQSVSGLTLADVRNYWVKTFRPDLTTIEVVGDVTPDEAKAVVEQDFGGWHAEGLKPEVTLSQVPPSRAVDNHVPDASAVQDTVALAESLPLSAHSPDRYALLLGDTILGGGFSSRLYNDLRVHGGLVYSIDSSFDFGRTRAAYSVSFGADPDKVRQAVAMTVRDIKTMQTQPVGDGELARAKAEVLRQLPMARASVDGVAAEDLHLTKLDLPLDQPDIAAKNYYAMTAADIEHAFAHWLRPQDLSRVVKGPAVTQ